VIIINSHGGPVKMDKELNLARFFAWARSRALQKLEARLQADPTLDPNWTFSDIMQDLLEEYCRQPSPQPLAEEPPGKEPPRSS
jgi:hypothetical protein